MNTGGATPKRDLPTVCSRRLLKRRKADDKDGSNGNDLRPMIGQIAEASALDPHPQCLRPCKKAGSPGGERQEMTGNNIVSANRARDE